MKKHEETIQVGMFDDWKPKIVLFKWCVFHPPPLLQPRIDHARVTAERMEKSITVFNQAMKQVRILSASMYKNVTEASTIRDESEELITTLDSEISL